MSTWHVVHRVNPIAGAESPAIAAFQDLADAQALVRLLGTDGLAIFARPLVIGEYVSLSEHKDKMSQIQTAYNLTEEMRKDLKVKCEFLQRQIQRQADDHDLFLKALSTPLLDNGKR